MRKEDIIAKIKDLKIPEFENNPELLKELIGRIEEESGVAAEEDIDLFRDLAKKRIQNLGNVPIPLTKGESKSFNERVVVVKERIEVTDAKISKAKERVKRMVDSNDQNLKVDISQSSILKKASKNVFGKKKNAITYKDYLELLELRKEAIENEKDSFKVK